MTRQVKVYFIKPNNDAFPSCLVYAESEEDARTSCVHPAIRLDRNSNMQVISEENNPYINEALSECKQMSATIHEDEEYNNGDMIDFKFQGKIHALQKCTPEFLDKV